MTKIGNDKHPWYCSEKVVYIAFHFVHADGDNSTGTEKLDALKNVDICREFETCLWGWPDPPGK